MSELSHLKGEETKPLSSSLNVSPYDIHDTMLYMIGFEEGSKYHSRFGQSIYKAVNAKERDCFRYKQDLKDTWCRCINYNFN